MKHAIFIKLSHYFPSMTKNIEDRIKESSEGKQKESKSTAIIWGAGSLVGYGNAVYQAVADDCNWKKAAFGIIMGTALALPAVCYYKGSKESKSSSND